MTTRRRLLPAVAAAALCVGGLSGCSREVAAPAPTAPSEDAQGGAPLATDHTTSGAELDQKLDAYLGAEKQVYGDESRAYLGVERPKLEIPVPPLEPMDREKPSLQLSGQVEPDDGP